ncbi:hypothetical protein Bca52824_041218 [Brassica carinata]|uniref:Auxin-responsive protein n=1 Tax=Brassica carinata TaxID=52824 RepID=A0A8X7RZA1_BRACI|nr:hypothetical protein Bca52824_041218 [Brassica carinata]
MSDKTRLAPIKPRLRDTLKGRRHLQREYDTCLFVKVYMEGAPIGRKLDLSTFSGYESLLENLSHMFDTSIICGKRDRKHHVLTYQDTDGDWMMALEKEFSCGTELLLHISNEALEELG